MKTMVTVPTKYYYVIPLSRQWNYRYVCSISTNILRRRSFMQQISQPPL